MPLVRVCKQCHVISDKLFTSEEKCKELEAKVLQHWTARNEALEQEREADEELAALTDKLREKRENILEIQMKMECADIDAENFQLCWDKVMKDIEEVL